MSRKANQYLQYRIIWNVLFMSIENILIKKIFSKIILHISVRKLPKTFEIIFTHTFRVYLTTKINSLTVSMGSRLPKITLKSRALGLQ